VNKKEVLQIIRNPKAISIGQLKEIEEMAADYPYFQGAHTLVAIGKKSQSSPEAQQSVVKAALYATDRQYLKELLAGNVKAAEPAPAATVEETTTVENTPEPVVEAAEKPAVEEEVAAAPEEVAEVAEQPAVEEDTAPVEAKAAEEPPFEPDPVITDADDHPHGLLSDSEHDDLLRQVFQNLEALKKTKSHYLEVERKLEDAEFEEAQAKAVKKATSNQEKEKPAPKKTTKSAAADTATAKKKIAKATAPAKDKKKSPASAKAKKPTKAAPEPKTPADPTKKKEQSSIIDEFIKNNPSIRPQTTSDAKTPVKDLSEPSQQLKDEVVTENLAQILTRQGKNERAIEVYEKLILKIPEKKAYFAARIADLQK